MYMYFKICICSRNCTRYSQMTIDILRTPSSDIFFLFNNVSAKVPYMLAKIH